MKQDVNEKIWDEGFDAFYEGYELDENPYIGLNVLEEAAWVAGYWVAKVNAD